MGWTWWEGFGFLGWAVEVMCRGTGLAGVTQLVKQIFIKRQTVLTDGKNIEISGRQRKG